MEGLNSIKWEDKGDREKKRAEKLMKPDFEEDKVTP